MKLTDSINIQPEALRITVTTVATDTTVTDLPTLPGFENIDKTYQLCSVCGETPCYYQKDGFFYCALCAEACAAQESNDVVN